jgi:hypothetical protein
VAGNAATGNVPTGHAAVKAPGGEQAAGKMKITNPLFESSPARKH